MASAGLAVGRAMLIALAFLTLYYHQESLWLALFQADPRGELRCGRSGEWS